MKTQKKSLKHVLLILAMLCIVCVAVTVSPLCAFAAGSTVIATPVSGSSTNNTVEKSGVTPLTTTYVAELTVYADSDSTSSWSTDGHAYISVKNISSSSIQVGQLTGIAPGNMVSVGTWGNKDEHTGLWYDLEEYFTHYAGAFLDSASLTMQLTSSQLSSTNTYITNHDSWSVLNNCSSFASGLWNSVSSTTLSAGTPNTPSSLENSIKSKSGYVNGKILSYDYMVYYAQGSNNPPVQSTEFR